MENNGWIKIYRQIQKHWIWDNPDYLKAWIAILITVNHEDNKVLIHGELFNCGRGESLLSLANWAKTFGKGWTIQRTRTFFNLLEKDKMINTEGCRKTTRLKVCNYDSYQEVQQTNNRQTTDKQQANNKQITTNKNDKNNNKLYNTSLFDDGGSELRPPIEKNDGGGSKKLPYNINNNNKTNTAGRRERKSKKKNYKYNEDIDYDKLMAFYNEKFKGIFPSIMKITDKRKELISDRINETSKEAVFTVLMNVYNSDYLKKPNDRGWKCDFDWIFGEESFVKILEGKYNTNSIETIKPNTYD